MDNRLQSKRTLGSATVTKVYATYSLAEYPEGIALVESRCTAMVIQPAYLLEFSIRTGDSEAAAAKETVNRIHESLRNSNPEVPQQFVEVSDGQEADLVLEVDDDGAISLHRLNAYMRDHSASRRRTSNMPTSQVS